MTTAAIHEAWWKVVRVSGNMLFFGTNNRIRAEDQSEAFKLLPLDAACLQASRKHDHIFLEEAVRNQRVKTSSYP
jgi:hypothetical protein